MSLKKFEQKDLLQAQFVRINPSKIAKKVFVHLAKNGGGAREYVEKAGMISLKLTDSTNKDISFFYIISTLDIDFD